MNSNNSKEAILGNIFDMKNVFQSIIHIKYLPFHWAKLTYTLEWFTMKRDTWPILLLNTKQ